MVKHVRRPFSWTVHRTMILVVPSLTLSSNISGHTGITTLEFLILLILIHHLRLLLRSAISHTACRPGTIGELSCIKVKYARVRNARRFWSNMAVDARTILDSLYVNKERWWSVGGSFEIGFKRIFVAESLPLVVIRLPAWNSTTIVS